MASAEPYANHLHLALDSAKNRTIHSLLCVVKNIKLQSESRNTLKAEVKYCAFNHFLIFAGSTTACTSSDSVFHVACENAPSPNFVLSRGSVKSIGDAD